MPGKRMRAGGIDARNLNLCIVSNTWPETGCSRMLNSSI